VLSLAKEHQFDSCQEELLVKHVYNRGQITYDPFSKQQGLDILSVKWKKILSESEWKIFQTTLKYFQREIYRAQFIATRRNKGVLKALPKAYNFLTCKPLQFKSIATVGKKMVFPYNYRQN